MHSGSSPSSQSPWEPGRPAQEVLTAPSAQTQAVHTLTGREADGHSDRPPIAPGGGGVPASCSVRFTQSLANGAQTRSLKIPLRHPCSSMTDRCSERPARPGGRGKASPLPTPLPTPHSPPSLPQPSGAGSPPLWFRSVTRSRAPGTELTSAGDPAAEPATSGRSGAWTPAAAPVLLRVPWLPSGRADTQLRVLSGKHPTSLPPFLACTLVTGPLLLRPQFPTSVHGLGT